MSENSAAGTPLRLGHVPGVTLTKWQRVWEERFRVPLSVQEVDLAHQLAGLRDGSLDMCFVRLPIDRTGLHAIPLYEEQMVAWVAKDHAFAAVDEVTMADLDGETVLPELDAVAIDRVLVGSVLVVPMSIARGASRRDLVHRPITDADPSPIALSWRMDDENPLLDEFVGVVRGRTPNSSRTAKERGTSTAPSMTKRVSKRRSKRPPRSR